MLSSGVPRAVHAGLQRGRATMGPQGSKPGGKRGRRRLRQSPLGSPARVGAVRPLHCITFLIDFLVHPWPAATRGGENNDDADGAV